MISRIVFILGLLGITSKEIHARTTPAAVHIAATNGKASAEAPKMPVNMVKSNVPYDANIGANVTLQFSLDNNTIADALKLVVIPNASSSKLIRIPGNRDCSKLKDPEFGGQDVKAATNVSGKLNQKYLVASGSENDLYGRVYFTCTGIFEFGQCSWTILGVKKTDYNWDFIQCVKEKNGVFRLKKAGAEYLKRIIMKEIHTKITPADIQNQSSTTWIATTNGTASETPKKPVNNGLSDGIIAVIAVICIAAVCFFVGVIAFVYRLHKSCIEARGGVQVVRL